MEALPRLPMQSFDLLTTSEKVSFQQKLKLYIASFYQEDPESYNNEIRTLEGLRATAVWPSIDINSCQIMKKYYCQLHFLKSRFPMEENQIASVFFAWKDEYTKMSCSVPDINFELMCMLINIGCIHSKLGAEDSRTSPEGMKMSCTHFQCAAWAFQTVRETFGQLIGLIMISSEQIRGMQLVCLAEAQECILEKSLLDNRKATIIAKIAVQLCDYYRQAWIAFQSGDECLVLDHLPNHKYLAQYLLFKISYHRSIALLYQGQQAEEQQKMGERVAFYQAAVDTLEDAIKQATKMSSSSQVLFKDTIAFTLDVVKGKHKAAVNENEFIYHEDVPQFASLQEIKGASLVKGIPFNVHDHEVSGNDIFGRLVPMEAHEASSLYSERKAQLLRNVAERVEKKDMELCDFLNSMQLEVLGFVKQSKGLPQDLVDRAASMVAKPNATRDLVESMGKLSNSYQEVESMLNEIQEVLKIEEESEKDYQGVMGKRPPSIIATDLAREAAKYQEAHGKASESNLNLHKAMTTHVANIKLLAQPLSQLVQIVPTLQLPDTNVDERVLEHMESLMNKIEEMKNQRMMLWTQLRDAVHQDDITGAIVTKENEQPLDVVFQQALEKHNKITSLIDQNLVAQDNICKALVEAYAKFTPTRKYLQDLHHKRNSTLSALMSSHDSYDDLLLKANKGIDFYAKLETNVSKLLGRIKSAYNVQQEERDQMLIKNGHSMQHVQEEPLPPMPPSIPEPQINAIAQPSKPKLKDYLDSMKEKRDTVIGPQMQYPASSMYPTQQEQPSANWNNEAYMPAEYVPSVSGYSQQYSNPINTSNFTNGGGYTQVNYTDKNINQELINKMNALKIPNSSSSAGGNLTSSNYDSVNSHAYAEYNNYNAPPPSTAFTNTVGATSVPAIATSQAVNYSQRPEQYTPEPSNGPSYPAYSNYSTNTAPSLTTDITMSENSNYKQQYADQTNNYYSYEQQPQAGTAGNPTSYYSYGQQQGADQTCGVNQYYQYYNSDAATNQHGAYTPMQNNVAQQQYNANYPTPSSANYPPVSSANYSNSQQYPYGGSTSSTTQVSQPYAQTTTANVYNSYSSGNQAAATPPPPAPSTPNPNMYNQNLQYGTNPTPPPANQTPPLSNPYGQNYYTSTNGGGTYSSTIPVDPTQYNQNPSQPPPQYNVTSNIYQYPTSAVAVTTTPSTAAVNYMSYTQPNGETYNQTSYPQGYSYNNQYSNGVYDYSQSVYNQTPSAGGGMTAAANSTYQYPGVQTPGANIPANVPAIMPNNTETNSRKKESSIDLLAGLDFSINQAPLIPQKEEKKVEKAPEVIEILPPKKVESDTTHNKVECVKKRDKVLMKGEPFKKPDTVTQFLLEVEKLEKYVDGLAVKTLNGPSNLELRWKEMQECQENMETTKKSISVARCYPLKNRSPDILPYDYSRVALVGAKDDYINASHVSVGPYCMDFIVTQLPLQHTVEEFWNMVWEQQVETVVCLLSDNEINEGCYWPAEPGKDLNVTRRVILAHSSTTDYWTERKLTISDEKESRLINIFQYTAWPGSLFPMNAGPYIDFLKLIIKSYEKQKCTGYPVLVHCLAGVGRSGICCTLLAALMELAAVACPLPDIPAIAAKISCARKNVLRDREHLKFVYTTLLHHMQTIRKGHTKSDNEKADETVIKETTPAVDPLSMLDPLWATRKP